MGWSHKLLLFPLRVWEFESGKPMIDWMLIPSIPTNYKTRLPSNKFPIAKLALKNRLGFCCIVFDGTQLASCHRHTSPRWWQGPKVHLAPWRNGWMVDLQTKGGEDGWGSWTNLRPLFWSHILWHFVIYAIEKGHEDIMSCWCFGIDHEDLSTFIYVSVYFALLTPLQHDMRLFLFGMTSHVVIPLYLLFFWCLQFAFFGVKQCQSPDPKSHFQKPPWPSRGFIY